MRGARRLGEWGIGTNYGITRFSRNMLFDEKMGGTIHLAMGQSFPECGGTNESGLHWDMLCDMADFGNQGGWRGLLSQWQVQPDLARRGMPARNGVPVRNARLTSQAIDE